ncbi:hypothetical protein EAE96_009361 [Botrytis aclada]|nr:hypothetical protein EAE96_009361 [Botrytis aclada]
MVPGVRLRLSPLAHPTSNRSSFVHWHEASWHAKHHKVTLSSLLTLMFTNDPSEGCSGILVLYSYVLLFLFNPSSIIKSSSSTDSETLILWAWAEYWHADLTSRAFLWVDGLDNGRGQ